MLLRVKKGKSFPVGSNGHTNTETQPVKFGFKQGAEEFPLMCVVAVAYPCNALCPHCPYTNSNIRKEFSDAPWIDPVVFRKIADECGKYGAFIRITGGGEPLLHKNLIEMVEYAKSVGAKIGIITNGSKFTEENTDRLLKCGTDMIEFSADAADSKTYDIVRKGLNFDILVRNVKRAVKRRNELKSSTKIVVSVVNQKTINIDEVKAFWEPLVDNMIIRKYLTWGTHTRLTGEGSADATPYLDTGKEPCPFPFERLNIDTRGEIIVCGYDISSRTKFGNVKDKTIHDIWLGPQFTEWRAKHLAGRGEDIPLCKECPDWKYRSWTHNYWKVVKGAEEKRQERLATEDMEGMVDESIDESHVAHDLESPENQVMIPKTTPSSK